MSDSIITAHNSDMETGEAKERRRRNSLRRKEQSKMIL